jgi:hypothetical protein
MSPISHHRKGNGLVEMRAQNGNQDSITTKGSFCSSASFDVEAALRKNVITNRRHYYMGMIKRENSSDRNSRNERNGAQGNDFKY